MNSPAFMNSPTPLKSPARANDYGAWLLAAAALVGLCLSVFYYLAGSGIHGTPGTVLVIVSTALLLGASLVMALYRSKGLALRIFLDVATVLDVLGTGLAAYMLDAYPLVALMVIGFIGWLIHMIAGPRNRVALVARQPAGAMR